jgi:hypothetical protein
MREIPEVLFVCFLLQKGETLIFYMAKRIIFFVYIHLLFEFSSHDDILYFQLNKI